MGQSLEAVACCELGICKRVGDVTLEGGGGRSVRPQEGRGGVTTTLRDVTGAHCYLQTTPTGPRPSGSETGVS